jgi:hypothetical protein
MEWRCAVQRRGLERPPGRGRVADRTGGRRVHAGIREVTPCGERDRWRIWAVGLNYQKRVGGRDRVALGVLGRGYDLNNQGLKW